MRALAVWLLLIIPHLPVVSGTRTFDEFMTALESLPSDKRQSLVDSCRIVRGPLPVTERSLSHFLFRSDSARCVGVAGDFNQWNPAADSMNRVQGTDLFVLTKSFKNDARLDYKLVIDGTRWILDPRNPNTCTGGFGPNSELAMPEYLHPTEILDKPDIPHGRVDTLSFRSVLLKNSRRVLVYLPPSYSREAKRIFPCVYVNDGGEYVTLGSMCSVLNNLIREGKIAEIIAVFIDPVDRNVEYWLDDAYMKAVAGELVPRIDSEYRTVRNPGGRCIMGASLGGLTALNGVRLRPGVFGLCGSQSGAFWIENERIIRLVREAGISGLRVYMDWGSYEPSIPAIHVRMADLLRSKGCGVETRVWHEGHSWGSWRAHLKDLLEALFPADTPAR